MNRVIAALAAVLAVAAFTVTVSADAATATKQTTREPVANGKLRTGAGYKATGTATGSTCKPRKGAFVPGTLACQVTQSSWAAPCWPTVKNGHYAGSWCPTTTGRSDPMLGKTGTLFRGPHTLGVKHKGTAIYRIVLANGLKCYNAAGYPLETGATYNCDPAPETPTALFGQPDRTHASWTITWRKSSGKKVTAHIASVVRCVSPYGK